MKDSAAGSVCISGDGVTQCTAVRINKDGGSDTAGCLRGVAYGNGLFVAVSPNRAVLTSPDGRQWTRHRLDHAAYPYAVAFTGRRFIAVGSAGAALCSTDGVRWNRLPSPARQSLAGLAGPEDNLMAVGVTGSVRLASLKEEPAGLASAEPSMSLTGNRK